MVSWTFALMGKPFTFSVSLWIMR